MVDFTELQHHQGHYIGRSVYARGTVSVHQTTRGGKANDEFTVIDWGQPFGQWLRTFSSSEFLRPRDEAVHFVDQRAGTPARQ